VYLNNSYSRKYGGEILKIVQVYVKHKGGKQYGISYRLKEPGQYVLYVKWGDEHVPGSPYQINV
jgi:hypothetical protein